MNIEQYKETYKYNKTSKMMQQYLDIKFAHMDSLLLFRMGDFYELFYDDAVIASKILNIVLTRRSKNDENEIPMCGIPHHALENYLNKLIEQNYRIAICDQLETPIEAKKRDGNKALVSRNVTRIITPGTVLEESILNSGIPNYLASLYISKDDAAICYCDISTSQIFVILIEHKNIINELARINPKEILLSEKHHHSDISNNIVQILRQRIYHQVDSCFSYNKCLKIILDFYKIHDIKAIGEISSSEIIALGSLLEYLSVTQKTTMPILPLPQIIGTGFMFIDSMTRRNLEITTNLQGTLKGSLKEAIDHTITKSGSRLLHQFLSNPLTNLNEINQRLYITNFFYKSPDIVKKIRELLVKTNDIERLITRINNNRSDARDLLSLKDTMDIALNIKKEFLNKYGVFLDDNIEKLSRYLSGDDEVCDLIKQTVRLDAPLTLLDGGFIKHDYHPKVAELYNLINNGKSYIEKLKLQYRNETQIENLKILHNNLLGLFIEISSKNTAKMLDSKFIHKQTMGTSIRYVTEELRKLESDMVNAKTLVISLEQEIYKDICREILKKSGKLILLGNVLSQLDVFCNFAYIAYEFNYILPILSNDKIFEIEEGRHTIVENSLHRDSKIFVHNNCNLSKHNIWLLTGPNMAGKSTFLRQNALIALLAQIGSFVPAKMAKIGIIDKIFSRIGSSDDLMRGQSTFMMEMLETSAILSQATDRSLIILDEIGRGTSTYDGVSIAWSVLEHIHDKIKARCLFATHYHELSKLSDNLMRLKNYTIAIEESNDHILFLHSIIEGSANKSYGLHVAKLAGLPESVIKRANEILGKLEAN
jgi:DNA mismatch repair protein MutS